MSLKQRFNTQRRDPRESGLRNTESFARKLFFQVRESNRQKDYFSDPLELYLIGELTLLIASRSE